MWKYFLGYGFCPKLKKIQLYFDLLVLGIPCTSGHRMADFGLYPDHKRKFCADRA